MLRQGIRETSTLQKYPIGYKYEEKGGERVFRYCLADTALTEKWGAARDEPYHVGNFAVAATKGDTNITIPVPAADLPAGYAEDYFKDGYMNVWSTINQIMLKIKGNEKDNGTTVVIHLEEPLLADVAVGAGFDLQENTYKSVGLMDAGGFQSVIVIPLVSVAAGEFFWGQTWGPVTGVAGFGTGVGGVANERAVYFQDDGAIGAETDLANVYQYAGFVLNKLSLGVDDIYFMLQLAP